MWPNTLHYDGGTTAVKYVHANFTLSTILCMTPCLSMTYHATMAPQTIYSNFSCHGWFPRPCMASTDGPLDHLRHNKWSHFATDGPPIQQRFR